MADYYFKAFQNNFNEKLNQVQKTRDQALQQLYSDSTYKSLKNVETKSHNKAAAAKISFKALPGIDHRI